MADTNDQTKDRTANIAGVDEGPDFEDESAVAKWLSEKGIEDGERTRRVRVTQAREEGRQPGPRPAVVDAIVKASK